MSYLIDERLCGIWNSVVPNGPTAYPEHMWDLCRLLAQYNLVVGNQQDVTTFEIGPFRIASTVSQAEIIESFIDSVLPVIIVQYCSKETVVQAVTGPLMFLTRIFCLTLSSGNLIKDPLEWSVLMYVKQENLAGRHPKEDEVLKAMSNQFDDKDLDSKVNKAIKDLMTVKPIVGNTPITLLTIDSDGKLVSVA